MNYKELIKEINCAVAGLSEKEANELNIIEWLKDNLIGFSCIGCGADMPDNEKGYCYNCNEHLSKGEQIETNDNKILCEACETKRTLKCI